MLLLTHGEEWLYQHSKMAKISTYNIDNSVNGDDLLLGTDINSSPPNLTKNFTVDKLAAYIRNYKTVEKIITDPLVIRAMGTAPIQIIDAPGANKVISPLMMSLTVGSQDPYNFPSADIKAGWMSGGVIVSPPTPWISGLSAPLNAAVQSSITYYPSGCLSATTFNTVNYNLAFGVGVVGAVDATQGERSLKIVLQYQVLDFNI